MATATVLVLSPGVGLAVKDALRDLSAAHLIEPFVWLDGTAAEPGLSDTVEVAGGCERDCNLQDWVSEVDILRICTIVPLTNAGVSIDSIVERDLADSVGAAAGVSNVVRIRILLTRNGSDQNPDATPAFDGWHNILVAPEDSAGSGLGVERLGDSDDVVEIARYAAPTVAALTGLWSECDHSPLDEEAVPSGSVIRLARSFYRRLDAADAEDAVRLRTLDQVGGLPLPRENGVPVVYIDDVGLATQTMARTLWDKHADVLKGPRQEYAKSTCENIGFWAALKMFFAFLWAALRNAPSAWYARMVNSVSTGVAQAVHGAVFGADPSAYQVVVNGRTAQGIPATWAEIGSASGQLDTALGGGEERSHSARANLSALWQDYSRGAMTLADAGSRSDALAPVQVGAYRGVLRSAADAIPGPAHRFDDIPGIVAATVGIHEVDATDILKVEALRVALQRLDTDQSLGLDARRTRVALDEWRARSARSFGVHVGDRLAKQFGDTVLEVKALLERLRAAAAADDPTPDQERGRKKLARWIQIASLLLVVVVGGCVFAVSKSRIQWWIGALIAVFAAVAWVVTLVFAFIHERRDLFQQLNKRKEVQDGVEVDRANLRTALRDLERLAQAYGQFLSWSRALGAFLEQPLGPTPPRPAQGIRIESGLPRCARVGYAVPKPEDTASVAEYLRRDLYGLGWLTTPWDLMLAESGNSIGELGRDIAADPTRMWSEIGARSGSSLDIWSSKVFEAEITSTGAEMMWAKARENLVGPKVELVRSLTERVTVDHDGRSTTTAAGEFFAGVQPSEGGDVEAYFDRGVLTDSSAIADLGRVAVVHRDTGWVGIGSVVVATQLSNALAVDGMSLGKTPDGDMDDPDWPVRMPTGVRI